ncbi:LemA family protein [Leptolyngbya valderiana BDU 20041]|nr:LemA family protein [Leptolyngbya valderiana BDU 20041]
MSMGVWIILAIVAVVAFVGLGGIGLLIAIYNKLVQLKEQFKNAFAQIEVQLKRRHDLIPNLVETAKGYMNHERETLEAVIAARNQAVSGLNNAAANPGDPRAMESLGAAEGALTGAMGRLMAVMEAYPDLKANDQMMKLQEEITSTENKVAFARQAFNDGVTRYNIYKKSFPQVAVAPLFGHGQDAALLEFEDSAQIQEAPKVAFN